MSEPQEPVSKAKQKLPESLTLASQYGFIDEAEQAWSFFEGQVITEAATIKALIERKAPIK